MLHAPRIPELAQRDRFVRRAVAEGRVLTLADEENASVPSQKVAGRTVQLFWSSPLEAERWAEALAGNSELQDISLEVFATDILPGIAKAKGFAGTDWVLKHDPSESEILFPKAKETIAHIALRDDHLLGIATGKSRRGVDRLFQREGWHESFATIQTADDHPSKPHPSMLLRAMLETDTTPDLTVMIGDTTYDMEMARAAGVAAIGVSWGYHEVAALQEAGAHLIIERFEDLPDAIDRALTMERCEA